MTTSGQSNIVHIYGLFDPRPQTTGELRYVGRTISALNQRLAEHINEAKRGRQIPLYFWIRKLVRLGLNPEISILEESDSTGWEEAENFNIAYFRSLGARLLNLAAGGKGSLGFQHSAETREKISKAGQGRKQSSETIAKRIKHFKGLARSPETREKISLATKGRTSWLKGKHLPLEQRLHLSKLATGRRASTETRAKLSAVRTGKHNPKLSLQWTGKGNPFYGRRHSDESRAKISATKCARATIRKEGVEKKCQ